MFELVTAKLLDDPHADLRPLLVEGEAIERAFEGRDLWLFTDRRLLIVEEGPEGVTGTGATRRSHLSIPFLSVTRFSLDALDGDDPGAELKLWVGADPTPVTRCLRGHVDGFAIQRTLARHVL